MKIRPPRRPRMFVVGAIVAAGLATLAPAGVAQSTQSVPPAQSAPAGLDAAVAAAASAQADASAGPPATLSYGNRPIVLFRASVLGRPPADRAAAARLVLDRLVDAGTLGPVEVRPVGPVMVLALGGQQVCAILPADLDALAGETLAGAASLAKSRLETALDELAELRRPGQLAWSGIQVLLATVAFVGMFRVMRKGRAAASRRLGGATERRLTASRVGDAEFVRSSRIVEVVHRLVALLVWALGLFLAYWWLTFSLRRFPYTRPWGESLRAFLLDRLALVGVALLHALPGLFTVLIIVLLTRFVSRIVDLFFKAVEGDRVSIPWLYPETAQPTRKLVTVALWLFAVAVSYPYLPGSDSQAFQGMSVFVGLVVSLGSTGLVNQVMSGFTLTYSRALRVGDYVSTGGVEGTVTQLGTLSTKIRTIQGEDVTIPNAVIVSQTVTNYSRLADSGGVFVPASVTIGYDVPWRQVQALLLLAAERTPGVRREPAPSVRQTGLEDAYVAYTLFFCPERPADRLPTLAAVHANILDAFNEYGVQIMSPNYEADSNAPKLVPRDQWFSAPAKPPEQ